MSKMTTEQFLSHLGIEVGNKFKVSEMVDYTYHYDGKVIHEWDNRNNCFTGTYVLSWLLDKEITPLQKRVTMEEVVEDIKKFTDKYGMDSPYYLLLKSSLDDIVRFEDSKKPKYTLTEKDKAFVSVTTIKEIARREDGQFYNENGMPLFIDDEMFDFISENSSVSLDELRECL